MSFIPKIITDSKIPRNSFDSLCSKDYLYKASEKILNFSKFQSPSKLLPETEKVNYLENHHNSNLSKFFTLSILRSQVTSIEKFVVFGITAANSYFTKNRKCPIFSNKTTAVVLSPAEHYRGRNTFSEIFTIFQYPLKSKMAAKSGEN